MYPALVGNENTCVFVVQTHTSSETVQTPCRLSLFAGRVVTQYFIQAKLHHQATLGIQ